MPKVSEQYRKERRDQIARAAIACLERRGVRDTSIADIVAESGLSTGAIYSHFTNKAELARYIAAHFLFVRLDELEDGARAGHIAPPREVLTSMLGIFGSTGMSPSLVLQLWSEATVDAGFRAEMTKTASRLFGSLAIATLPWARSITETDAEAHVLAERTVRTIVALAQGFIANSALFGPRDPVEYVESAAAALGA